MDSLHTPILCNKEVIALAVTPYPTTEPETKGSRTTFFLTEYHRQGFWRIEFDLFGELLDYWRDSPLAVGQQVKNGAPPFLTFRKTPLPQ